jgi:biopolymer transport protein ExbB
VNRRLLILIMVTVILLNWSSLIAADPSPDLRTTTLTARDQAQTQLEQARLRIAEENAALLKEFQATLSDTNATRERLTKATQDAQAANDALAVRTKEHHRETAQIKSLLDRVMIAARLPSVTQHGLASKPTIEQLNTALSAIDQRLAALPQRLAMTLRDEPIIARNGHQVTATVLRLGEARAIALGADNTTRGLLERASDGSSWLVTGPLLTQQITPQLSATKVIPLDVTGTAAQQPEEVHRTLGEWIKAGRFFIWPILGVFLLGMLIALERLFSLIQRRVDPRRLIEIAGHLARGDHHAATAAVSNGRSPLDRVLAAGLSALGRPREAREAAVEQALLSETGQLTRGLPAIAVLAGVAPLLGLLGTVTGMIDMFAVIAAQGSGNAKSLSGGISEALICTQAGMLVAIPLLLLHAWLARLADRRAQILEEAACGMLGLTEHGDANDSGHRTSDNGHKK